MLDSYILQRIGFDKHDCTKPSLPGDPTGQSTQPQSHVQNYLLTGPNFGAALGGAVWFFFFGAYFIEGIGFSKSYQ